MLNFRDQILSHDSIMRLALAFYSFIKKNDNWTNNIENVISSNFKNLSDYDFSYDKKLYSFYYQYIDEENVRCCVREYDTFYDNASSFAYLIFDYALENRNITKIIKQGTYVLNK